jgi:MoxR-like ATPase
VPRTAFDAIEQEPVVRLSELSEAMGKVQQVHVSEVFLRHCVDLVDRTRSCEELELGCSPRAGIALVQAARARAFIHGRTYVTPDDLFALAPDVMLHRMRPTYEAQARGRTTRMILDELMSAS